MRLHKLPEAWIAPPELRELRELVRYRAKLVCIRTGLKAQVKAVLAKHCLHPPVKDLWGVAGPRWLDSIELPDGYRLRVDSYGDLVGVLDGEIDEAERRSINRSATTAAIRRSSNSMVSAPRWAPCSWSRSAT